MKIKIFQVDAFASQVFSGNPAAVCPLDEWIPDELMQNIAAENNLSETAFFVQQDKAMEIRWFTPKTEVDLCGHATLASGHVLFNHLGFAEDTIIFSSRSGELRVSRQGELITLDFPAAEYHAYEPPEKLVRALGKRPLEACRASKILALFESEEDIINIQPDFELLKEIDAEGVIITSRGEIVDFVSRFFAPAMGINEDPVTGSAHTLLIPFWAKKYNKNSLTALQLSERKGELICKHLGERVKISGKAVTYLSGEIHI
ncbi:MAG: PhzF family phenazine biosynthesis protein [Bacteroidota bacterium]|nr:PhzF family phenazine biosynthesis protein [Bacteroidota bacterium]